MPIMTAMSDPTGITLSIADAKPDRGKRPPPRPQLILALECDQPSTLSVRYDLGNTRRVLLGRGAARTYEHSGEDLQVRVPDRWMSSRHARLEESFGRWVLVDTGSKNGTLVNGVSTTRAVLQDGDLFELGHTMFLFREAVALPWGAPLAMDFGSVEPPAPGLRTLIPEVADHFDKLAQVATSTIPILLCGESGTGKEVIARAAHILSARDGRFVAVNCGAIPETLIESELFGHKKGAFSGAVDDKPGLVRSADGGTLFLDEIGDLPAPSQAALLRVLQEREVMPVGGNRPQPVDLRVIAATHRDLDELVHSGSFRHDLFARLAGFRLTLPPLRERRDDLGLLIGTLFAKLTQGQAHAGIAPDAVRVLFSYPWPLNIRELEQTLATAVVLSGGSPVELDHLPEYVRMGQVLPTPGSASAPAASAPDSDNDDSFADKERPLTPADQRIRDELIQHLREERGNVSAIARVMGKDRKQIQRWLKRFGLNAEAFRA